VAVTDAAANMKKAISESVEIKDHVTCVDHILNTCLTKSFDQSEELALIVKKCKALAQRTHQSSLDWQDIKKSCGEANIEAVKIIQPVVTRWNSNYMMLQSIAKIKAGLLMALETLANKPDLLSLIPSESEFKTITLILPFLKQCKDCSDSWSSEKSATMHTVQTDLVSLHLIAVRMVQAIGDTNAAVTDCINAFMTEFNQRLPRQGASIQYYNFGSLLHPYYRGHSLRKIGDDPMRDAAIKVLVDNHPSTKEFNQQNEEETTSLEDLAAMDEAIMDPFELDFMKTRVTQRGSQPQDGSSELKPPLQMEYEKFRTMRMPEKDKDVLEWWKENANELPILAEVARSQLAIPVTSASSERMFSVGGKVVSDYRHNLSAEKTSMLVFINQNYGKVKTNIKEWTKTCEAEPYEMPDLTPTKTVPPTPTATTQKRGPSQEPRPGPSKKARPGASPGPSQEPGASPGPSQEPGARPGASQEPGARPGPRPGPSQEPGARPGASQEPGARPGPRPGPSQDPGPSKGARPAPRPAPSPSPSPQTPRQGSSSPEEITPTKSTLLKPKLKLSEALKEKKPEKKKSSQRRIEFLDSSSEDDN